MNDELLSKLLLGAVSGAIFYGAGRFIFPWIAGIKQEEVEKEPDNPDPKTKQQGLHEKEPKDTRGSQSFDTQLNQLNLDADKAIEQINRLGKSGVFTENEVAEKIEKITSEKNIKVAELTEKKLTDDVQKSKEFIELKDLYRKGIISKDELESKTLVLIERFKAKTSSDEPKQKDETPISISDNMKRLDNIIEDLKKHSRN